jgi:hypothetical protein
MTAPDGDLRSWHEENCGDGGEAKARSDEEQSRDRFGSASFLISRHEPGYTT